jgi:hypothetical protein
MQKHNASLLDILRGSIIIPGELLSSRAHFRLMNSEAKLNRNLYIYNLSKIREGYGLRLKKVGDFEVQTFFGKPHFKCKINFH